MKLLQRMAALCLAALLLAAPVRAAATVGTQFTDVPATHWAHDSIRWASHYGLVGGEGKTFGLGRQVTRAEYATMLCRLMGWEMLSPEEGSFSDNQDTDKWYYSAVETAYANGALLGLGDACGVNEPLPREEMAAMTVRALLGAETGRLLAGIVQDGCPFTDVTTNPGYITIAYHMGLIGGMGYRSFSPQSASTREQAAAILLRAYDRMHDDVAQGALPEGVAAVRVSPLADDGGAIPIYARAPLENVYHAAVAAGVDGAVLLSTEPYNVALGETISQEALAELLADEATVTGRSSRCCSSYLINGDAVVWYESEADIAQKVQLCRLLGVSGIYFE